METRPLLLLPTLPDPPAALVTDESVLDFHDQSPVHRIRILYLDTVVLHFSGQGHREVIIGSRPALLGRTLNKPFVPDVMVRTLQEMLDDRRR